MLHYFVKQRVVFVAMPCGCIKPVKHTTVIVLQTLLP